MLEMAILETQILMLAPKHPKKARPFGARGASLLKVLDPPW